jgi:hypothetical protein
MKAPHHPSADRREFLRACGRWGALAVLTGGVAALVRTGRVQTRSAACWEPRPCGGCTLAVVCDLPAARAAQASTLRGAV